MKIFELPSEHGHLRGAIWENVENPIGTIQIAHGLVEYHDRYDEFAKFLNEHGYIVYCNDLQLVESGTWNSTFLAAIFVTTFHRLVHFRRLRHLWIV